MRTPAQTSINIIEKEDVAGKRIQAKYHAMENQESQLSGFATVPCLYFASDMYRARQIEMLAKRFDSERVGAPPHVRTNVHSSSASKVASNVASYACMNCRVALGRHGQLLFVRC